MRGAEGTTVVGGVDVGSAADASASGGRGPPERIDFFVAALWVRPLLPPSPPRLLSSSLIFLFTPHSQS